MKIERELLCLSCALLLIGAGCSSKDDGGEMSPSGGEGGEGGSSGNEDAGASGSSGGGGSSGSGGQDPTNPTGTGEPVDAPAMEWTYVATPGALCQDGNETGFGINIHPTSDKLIIYMEGGGACFNATTCLANPQSWDGAAIATSPPGGVLSRADTNPFYDWNMVYMPYCTGDVFSGTSGMGEGFMGRPQQGFVNVGLYLERIVPTFPDVTEVVLSGASAGGFGAAWNGLRTQDAFGEGVTVHVLDDSGPPLGPELLTPCMQQRLATTWGWAESIHPDCTDCDPEAGSVTVPLVELALSRASSGQRFGVLSNDEDGVIKIFLSYAQNDCASWDALFAPGVPAGAYPAGLAAIRDRTAGVANFALYEVAGSGHTFLGGNLANVSSGGTVLRDWVIQFRDGDPAWANVVPVPGS